MTAGIHALPIDETPVAILDFETTGFSPKCGARIVEVAVVRMDPGEEPKVVLDTLVDPRSSVLCTSVHGIDDADVVGAPEFRDVAGPVAHAMCGAVLATFNAAFDVPFLESESRAPTRMGQYSAPPVICLMYLRPVMAIGPRVSLESALRHEHLPVPNHRAAHDALGAALLWRAYRDRAIAEGARTFADLNRIHRDYKFMRSWERPVYSVDDAHCIGPAECGRPFLPRGTPISYPVMAGVSIESQMNKVDTHRARADRRRAYRRALFDALLDGELDRSEIETLRQFQQEEGITPGEVRAIHAAFFANLLQDAFEDHFVSHDDTARFTRLGDALHDLGWAPTHR